MRGDSGGRATYQFSPPALMAGSVACKDAMRVAVLHIGRAVELIGRHDEEMMWWATSNEKEQLDVGLKWKDLRRARVQDVTNLGLSRADGWLGDRRSK